MKRPARWQQVKEIVHSALALPPDERESFLAEACRGQDSLLKEVESLIRPHVQKGSFCDSPAYEMSAPMLANERALKAADLLDRYRISSLIGAVGMGEIYPERHKSASRKLRFKVQGVYWNMAFLLIVLILPLSAQTLQTSPPDATRQHQRITQVETPGRRIELTALKGAVLFVNPEVQTNKPVPLIVNFHGVPWLVQYHIAKEVPRAALITVNLGAGSRAYGSPFEQPETFQSILDEASKVLKLKRGWSSITLIGFSAGYGAVRAILRQEENFARVNNVLLLDGIHASYLPEGKPLADGGTINATDLDSFVRFAHEAVKGKKSFVITHSQIVPNTYASTTECVDYLLAKLGLKRQLGLDEGPMGMQQLSVVNKSGFRIRGYAGNTASDHVDYLHAMYAWLRLLKIK